MNCINYNSKLKSSGFLLGSSMWGCGKESEIRKFIIQCSPHPKGVTANGLFSPSRGPAGLVLVLSSRLVSSILGVVKVPPDASPEVPHTLSCLSYTTVRKQDLVYYLLSSGILGEEQFIYLALNSKAGDVALGYFLWIHHMQIYFFFLQTFIFLSMLTPELPTPLQESFY